MKDSKSSEVDLEEWKIDGMIAEKVGDDLKNVGGLGWRRRRNSRKERKNDWR